MASKRVVGTGIGGVILALAATVAVYFEGYIPTTYADPVGIPTICYGHTGPDVTPGRTATRAECDALLQQDLAEAYSAVQRCILVPMKPHQAAALTSATFNAGPKIVCGSTLQKLANRGRWAEACSELSRWVWSSGRKLPGLIKRRAAERAMCEGKPWSP